MIAPVDPPEGYSVRVDAVEAASRIFRVLGRAQEVVSYTELDPLLDEMLDLIVQTCNADAGILFFLNHELNVFNLKTCKGWKEDCVRKSIKARSGIAGETIQTGKPIVIEKLGHDHQFDVLLEQDVGDVENVISLPLIAHDEPLGLVQIFNYVHAPLPLLQFLGEITASQIEKSLLLQASHQREEQLQALITVLQEISVTLDRDQILSLILENVCQLLHAEGSSLFLVDPDTDELILYLSTNLDRDILPSLRLPPGTGIIGRVAKTGEIIRLNDVCDDRRHYKGVDEVSGIETKSLVAVPLSVPNIVLGQNLGTTGNHIIGGIEVINKKEGDFDDMDVQLLQTLAEQAATVMHVAKLYADADELFINTIRALVAAIDAKDPYTKEHSQRVSDYSVIMAQEMGLSVEMQRRVRVGALLHDIGKIGVSDTILAKRDRLSDDEWNHIKLHPQVGVNILQRVNLSDDEISALGQHHERMDGLGYPKGLDGEEISLVARIVAVADVFDALTSDRPYRPAMSVESAMNLLENEAGDHLDPTCVDAFFEAQIKGKILL